MKKYNKIYNFWMVLYIGEPNRKTGKRDCIARCSCGRLYHIKDFYSIKTGKSKMCKACSAKTTKNATKHGMNHTRLYKIWENIKYRCGRHKNYLNISYCKNWDKFESFYNWATNNGYKDGLTIDRIDSYGNYCPENCRWATSKEQARNTKRNVFVWFNNKKMTIAELAEINNLKYDTVWARLKKSWSVKDSIKGIR